MTPNFEAPQAAPRAKPVTPAPEEVFTIAPPPCSSMSGISCFMQTKTPRRLVVTTRSKSASVMSAMGVGRSSTPALLKAMSSRPKRATVLSSASPTWSLLVTSQAMARAVPPSCSICSAVACAACWFKSTATTSAPSWAKATAVALPMPEPAPVTNATLPENLPLLFVVIVASSDRQERLDGAAFVHGAVPLGGLVEGQGEVEDLPGVDLAVPDEVDEFGQEPANGRRAAVEVRVAEEQLVAGELHVVGDADIADVAAGSGRSDRLQHRLLRADRFDHGMGAEPVGEILDAGDAIVAAFLDDVGGTEV